MAKKQSRPQFAVCVASDGCDDLQVWKLYRVLPDAAAAAEGYLRVWTSRARTTCMPPAASW